MDSIYWPGQTGVTTTQMKEPEPMSKTQQTCKEGKKKKDS